MRTPVPHPGSDAARFGSGVRRMLVETPLPAAPAMRRLLPLLVLCPTLALAQPTGSTILSGGGPGGDVGERVASQPYTGHTAVVGTFEQTATFGPGVSVTSADAPAARSDAFVAFYAPDGTALWARRMGTGIFNDFGAGVALGGGGFFGEPQDKIEPYVFVLLEAIERTDYGAVLEHLAEASKTDVAAIAEALDQFALAEMAHLVEQAHARQSFLDRLEALARDPGTLEASSRAAACRVGDSTPGRSAALTLA